MRIPLNLAPGLVTDETTFSTPARWVDGNNVRFWLGKPETIGGWTSAVSGLAGVCRNALAWIDISGTENIAFGQHNALEVYVGGALFDITPAGYTAGPIDGAGGPGYGTSGYGDADFGESASIGYQAQTWSLQTYGEWLIACPRGDTIYSWENNTAVVAAAVTNAPATVGTILVTPERQLLAFGCNEEVSATYNPMCIRGSDIEDITDWTTTAANNAFESILEGGGMIVGAALFGSYVAVWTDTSVYLGQFIGAVGQTYRWDLVDTNCGLLGPNAMTVFNQTAYWVTPDLQFYAWQIGASPQMIPCPILRDFGDNMVGSQKDKVVCTGVSRFGEVWWFYPDARDGIENSRYVAMSTFDGAWFKGQLARTAAIDSGPTAFPLYVTYDGASYWHETGNTADGGVMEYFIESGDFYLDKGQRRVELQGIWPDFEDQTGAVTLTLRMRAYPQSDVREKGPYTLASGRSKKDFRAEGRVGSVLLEGSSAPAYMRLGLPTFAAVVTGEQ